MKTIYLVIDPEVDPTEMGPNGMSAAICFVSRSQTKARKYRDNQNKGLDEGEPEYFIVKHTAHN